MSLRRPQLSLRPVGLALGLAAIFCLISVARASADVYWANIQPESIAHVKNNGTELDQEFLGLGIPPEALAIQGEKVFFTSRTNSALGSANLDGTEVKEELVTGTELPAGIAVEGEHLYWSEFNKEKIGRANIDGTEVERGLISPSSRPFGLAIDGEYIYWANFGIAAIGRAKLNGEEVIQEFIPITIGGTSALTISGEYIYWSNNNGGSESIGRAKLDGTEIEEEFIEVRHSEILGLTVEGEYIYWTNINTQAIGRARLDGTGIEAAWQPAELPFGIATDNSVEPEPEPETEPEPTPTPATEPASVQVSPITPDLTPTSVLAPTGPASPTPGAPAVPAQLALQGLERQKGKGTGTLMVGCDGAGIVSVSGPGVKATQLTVSAAGTTEVPVIPVGAYAKRLESRHRGYTTVDVTFTPDGGAAMTTTRRMRLVHH